MGRGGGEKIYSNIQELEQKRKQTEYKEQKQRKTQSFTENRKFQTFSR